MEFTAERNITIDEYLELEPVVFAKESDLCDKIEWNIEYLTEQLFESKYISHNREYKISYGFGKGSLRVDFLIETEDDTYMCEVKNPTHQGELRNAIGQLLQYDLLRPHYKACLITSKFDKMLLGIIKKHNLPIHVYVITENNLLKML